MDEDRRFFTKILGLGGAGLAAGCYSHERELECPPAPACPETPECPDTPECPTCPEPVEHLQPYNVFSFPRGFIEGDELNCQMVIGAEANIGEVVAFDHLAVTMQNYGNETCIPKALEERIDQEQGTLEVLNVGETDYEVTVLAATDLRGEPRAVLSINGEVTDELEVGDIEVLHDGRFVGITGVEINESEPDRASYFMVVHERDHIEETIQADDSIVEHIDGERYHISANIGDLGGLMTINGHRYSRLAPGDLVKLDESDAYLFISRIDAVEDDEIEFYIFKSHEPTSYVDVESRRAILDTVVDDIYDMNRILFGTPDSNQALERYMADVHNQATADVVTTENPIYIAGTVREDGTKTLAIVGVNELELDNAVAELERLVRRNVCR